MSPIDHIPMTPVDPPVNPDPDTADLPFVTHEGELQIAGHTLKVYQLSTGIRIIAADDLETFLGLADPGEAQ